MSAPEAEFSITVSFTGFVEHFKDRREEGMERALTQAFGEQRREHKSGIRGAGRRSSLLPYGQDVPGGTEARMKRQEMKSRFFFPEEMVWAERTMWAPWRVRPSSSSRPIGNMLQSGTLFTF